MPFFSRRLITSVVIVYIYLGLVAILVPPTFAEMPAELVSLVNTAEAAIPMIGRVTAYRHPHPEQLRALVTLAWLALPVLSIGLWGSEERLSEPLFSKDSPVSAILRYLATIAVCIFSIFYTWYWPNLSFSPSGQPISRPLDTFFDQRKTFFYSTPAVVQSGPIWLSFVACSIEAMLGSSRSILRMFSNRSVRTHG